MQCARSVAEKEGQAEAETEITSIQPVAGLATEIFAEPREEKDEGELIELVDALLPLSLCERVLVVVVVVVVVGRGVDGDE